MPAVKWPWFAVVVLTAAAGVLLILPRQDAARLRLEIQALREQNGELVQLREVKRRLEAAQIAPEKLAVMRADHAEVARLRAELETLKRQAEETAKMTKTSSAAEAAGPERLASVTEEMVPVSRLKNAGFATPAATLETALWAAVGGDTDALAKTFLVDPPLRMQIEIAIAQLPASDREKYDTPERFLALMTAQDVPLGEAHIMEPKQEVPGNFTLVAQMRSADGKPKTAVFSLRQEGYDWRLVVPAQAVEKYLARLKGNTAPPYGR